MKHIKKYRGLLSRRKLDSIRSKARSRAKDILERRFKEEYVKIFIPIYRKLKREEIKQKNDNTNTKREP